MTMINVQIDGEQVMLQKLIRFQQTVRSPEPVYRQLADWFAGSQKKRFEREGAFAGTKWAPLSPTYAAWKKKQVGNKPILQFSGDLMKSLTQRPLGVEVITKDHLIVGTDVPYAFLHQYGSGPVPARPPLIQATGQQKREIRRIVQAWLVKGGQ